MKEKNSDVRSDFYASLENAFDSLPENTVKNIIRDFNAQIGRELNYWTKNLHIMSNGSEVQAINFAVSKDLVESSTFFYEKIFTNKHEYFKTQ